jgi:hypothetical protein
VYEMTLITMTDCENGEFQDLLAPISDQDAPHGLQDLLTLELFEPCVPGHAIEAEIRRIEAAWEEESLLCLDESLPPSPEPLAAPRRSQFLAVLEFLDPRENHRVASVGPAKSLARQIEHEFRRYLEAKSGCSLNQRWSNQRLCRRSWYFASSCSRCDLNRAVRKLQKRWRSARPVAIYEIEHCRPIQLQRITRRLFDGLQPTDSDQFSRVCDRATLTAIFYDGLYDAQKFQPPSRDDVILRLEAKLRSAGHRIYQIDRIPRS